MWPNSSIVPLTFRSCCVQHLLTPAQNLSEMQIYSVCGPSEQSSPHQTRMTAVTKLLITTIRGHYKHFSGLFYNIRRMIWACKCEGVSHFLTCSLFKNNNFVEFISENCHWFTGWQMLRAPLSMYPLTVSVNSTFNYHSQPNDTPLYCERMSMAQGALF